MANVTISNPEVLYNSVSLQFHEHEYMEEWQDTVSFRCLGIDQSLEVEAAWTENHGKTLVVEVYDIDKDETKEMEFSIQDILELMEN